MLRLSAALHFAGLALYAYNVDPTTAKATLRVDSPHSTDANRIYDKSFGEFAEIYLADELFRLAKQRDFEIQVEDLPNYTEYNLSRLTEPDKKAIQAFLDRMEEKYAKDFIPHQKDFDVKDVATENGFLRGPDVSSPEGMKTFWYEIVELSSDSLASKILRGKLLAKATVELGRILSTRGVEYIKGPIIREADGIRRIRYTLKMKQEGTPGVKRELEKDLKYFEYKLQGLVRKVASTTIPVKADPRFVACAAIRRMLCA